MKEIADCFDGLQLVVEIGFKVEFQRKRLLHTYFQVQEF
jgi:hypothetical protein